MITLASRGFESFHAVLLAGLRCLRIFGFVSVAWCCDPTFIAYPHGLPIVRYLYWFFKYVFYLVLCFSYSVAMITLMVPAQVLIVALRSVAVVAVFFPKSAVFALVLGGSVLGSGILALALLFLGYASGVAFLAPSTYPTLRPSPAVAGLVGFRCGPPLWWSLSVCGGPFWGGGAVSSFSSARFGVGYC